MDNFIERLNAFFDERSIVENLREYNNFRSRILDSLQKITQILENAIIFQITLWFSGLFLITTIFIETQALTLFSMHPTLMVLGGVMIIGQGIVAFKHKVMLQSFAPIMSSTRRNKLYAIHRTFQCLGVAFILLGMLFIFMSKIKNQHTLLPHTVHAVVGWIVLAVFIVQVVVGMRKLDNFTKSNTKTYRWHGDVGALGWDVMCLATFTGYAHYLPPLNSISLYCTVLVLVFLVWLAVHTQLRLRPDGLAADDKTAASAADHESLLSGRVSSPGVELIDQQQQQQSPQRRSGASSARSSDAEGDSGGEYEHADDV